MMHIIAAIDIETTGLNPHYHDIIELAIQPLNADFSIMEEIPPFVSRIKARRPQHAPSKALEINGLDPNAGEEYNECLARLLFWLEEYSIEKIDILGQNVDFDRTFIESKHSRAWHIVWTPQRSGFSTARARFQRPLHHEYGQARI